MAVKGLESRPRADVCADILHRRLVTDKSLCAMRVKRKVRAETERRKKKKAPESSLAQYSQSQRSQRHSTILGVGPASRERPRQMHMPVPDYDTARRPVPHGPIDSANAALILRGHRSPCLVGVWGDMVDNLRK